MCASGRGMGTAAAAAAAADAAAGTAEEGAKLGTWGWGWLGPAARRRPGFAGQEGGGGGGGGARELARGRAEGLLLRVVVASHARPGHAVGRRPAVASLPR